MSRPPRVPCLLTIALLLGTTGVTLISPSQAAARPSAHEIAVSVARATTHGWIHDGLSPDEMLARYREGSRLFVTCGNVAELARRLLVSRGYSARIVHTLTRKRFNRRDDGHLMVEVRTGEGWVLYDLSTNRVAVNRAGRRIGFLRQVRAENGGRSRWRVIARDRLLNTKGLTDDEAAYARWVFSHRARWHDRILGVPLLPADAATGSEGWIFKDATQRERVESYSPYYRWVPRQEWRAARQRTA